MTLHKDVNLTHFLNAKATHSIKYFYCSKCRILLVKRSAINHISGKQGLFITITQFNKYHICCNYI